MPSQYIIYPEQVSTRLYLRKDSSLIAGFLQEVLVDDVEKQQQTASHILSNDFFTYLSFIENKIVGLFTFFIKDDEEDVACVEDCVMYPALENFGLGSIISDRLIEFARDNMDISLVEVPFVSYSDFLHSCGYDDDYNSLYDDDDINSMNINDNNDNAYDSKNNINNAVDIDSNEQVSSIDDDEIVNGTDNIDKDAVIDNDNLNENFDTTTQSVNIDSDSIALLLDDDDDDESNEDNGNDDNKNNLIDTDSETIDVHNNKIQNSAKATKSPSKKVQLNIAAATQQRQMAAAIGEVHDEHHHFGQSEFDDDETHDNVSVQMIEDTLIDTTDETETSEPINTTTVAVEKAQLQLVSSLSELNNPEMAKVIMNMAKSVSNDIESRTQNPTKHVEVISSIIEQSDNENIAKIANSLGLSVSDIVAGTQQQIDITAEDDLASDDLDDDHSTDISGQVLSQDADIQEDASAVEQYSIDNGDNGINDADINDDNEYVCDDNNEDEEQEETFVIEDSATVNKRMHFLDNIANFNIQDIEDDDKEDVREKTTNDRQNVSIAIEEIIEKTKGNSSIYNTNNQNVSIYNEDIFEEPTDDDIDNLDDGSFENDDYNEYDENGQYYVEDENVEYDEYDEQFDDYQYDGDYDEQYSQYDENQINDENSVGYIDDNDIMNDFQELEGDVTDLFADIDDDDFTPVG